MPDPTLHGNGDDCPACELRREDDEWQTGTHPCNNCGGTGRIPRPTLRILNETVAQARKTYWRLTT